MYTYVYIYIYYNTVMWVYVLQKVTGHLRLSGQNNVWHTKMKHGGFHTGLQRWSCSDGCGCRCQMDHHRYANLVADFKPQMVADFSDTSMFARKTGKKNICESTRNECILLGPQISATSSSHLVGSPPWRTKGAHHSWTASGWWHPNGFRGTGFHWSQR